MSQNNDLDHYEASPEGQEIGRLFQALRSVHEAPHVPPAVEAKILAMLAQPPAWRGLWAWLRTHGLFPSRPVLVYGVLAAILCLSLTINGWLMFRMQQLTQDPQYQVWKALININQDELHRFLRSYEDKYATLAFCREQLEAKYAPVAKELAVCREQLEFWGPQQDQVKIK